jgi:hypothetical protein
MFAFKIAAVLQFGANDHEVAHWLRVFCRCVAQDLNARTKQETHLSLEEREELDFALALARAEGGYRDYRETEDATVEIMSRDTCSGDITITPRNAFQYKHFNSNYELTEDEEREEREYWL